MRESANNNSDNNDDDYEACTRDPRVSSVSHAPAPCASLFAQAELSLSERLSRLFGSSRRDATG